MTTRRSVLPSPDRTRWTETKFRWKDGHLRAGDFDSVSSSSLLNTELLAAEYETLIPAHARGRLADFGCGAAPLFGLYEDRVDHTVLLDWPNSGAARVIDLWVDLGAALPIAPGSFDTVLVTEVLEHLSDPNSFLCELGRVTASGGTLVGSVPFLAGLHEVPHDHGRYTTYGLQAMLERAGFTDARIHAYGGGIDVVVDLLAKHLVGHGSVSRHVAIAIQRFWLHARRRTMVRRLNSQQQRFPIGYSFVAHRA